MRLKNNWKSRNITHRIALYKYREFVSKPSVIRTFRRTSNSILVSLCIEICIQFLVKKRFRALLWYLKKCIRWINRRATMYFIISHSKYKTFVRLNAIFIFCNHSKTLFLCRCPTAVGPVKVLIDNTSTAWNFQFFGDDEKNRRPKTYSVHVPCR